MEVKILHIYEDVMNLYGEYANICVLEKYLKDLGHEVKVDKLSLYDEKDISNYDFYYMGSGTESKQKLALMQLKKYAETLDNACKVGKVMLFTGNSFELLGAKIVDADGNAHEALQLADFVTTQCKKRIVCDALAVLDNDILVGFINKCSKTSGVEHPLFSMKMGYGNEIDRGDEGFCLNNCFGTHLTGPILVKNPMMLKKIARLLVGSIDETVNYEYMERSYQTTVEALQKRLSEDK